MAYRKHVVQEWRCTGCGYIGHTAPMLPNTCPSCQNKPSGKIWRNVWQVIHDTNSK